MQVRIGSENCHAAKPNKTTIQTLLEEKLMGNRKFKIPTSLISLYFIQH